MFIASKSGAQRFDDAEKWSVVAGQEQFSFQSVSKSQESFSWTSVYVQRVPDSRSRNRKGTRGKHSSDGWMMYSIV